MEKPHRRLDAWNSSVDLVMAIYQITERFPQEERFALISQLRRAATSVPSNIAEGAARQTKKEFANYIHIAQGSHSELDTHLEIARRLNYVPDGDWEKLDGQIQRIDKMLSGLLRHLKKNGRLQTATVSVNPSRLTPHASRP
jgi:four helix bundle protein